MAKVLIVDDSSFMRLKLNQIVQKGGHETHFAVNGHEGLTQAQTLHPNCIITDDNMPEMSGTEMVTALKNLGSSIPIIVSTADCQESTRDTYLDLGVVEFLNKPLKEDVLLASIDKALACQQPITAAT